MRIRCVLIVVAALASCATSSEPAPAPNVPPHRPWNEPREQLDKGDIVYGMQQMKPAVGNCFDRYKTTGMFNVALTIVGDGHVSQVSVRGPHAETNDCIGHAIAAAKFPSFTGAPISIVYPFILR